MDGWQILLFIGLIALAAVGAYFAHLHAKQRREAMAALAAELGWSYSAQKDHSHDEQYANFEIFRRGHDRAAYNTLTGRRTIEGRDFACRMGDFTYKVTTGSGKHRRTTTYNFSYLILHLPFARTDIPALLIRREGMFDKLAGAFGFDDIDFESAEFSRKFHVKSQDKRFAYDVIDPRMMEFLLGGETPTVDLEHGMCCLSDGSSRWEPQRFKAMLDWAGAFFDHWPDHVVRSLSEARS
jgi:hypothetical protein